MNNESILNDRIIQSNSNILKLENLIQNKQGNVGNIEERKRIEKLVTLATTTVLKDISPYTLGKKEISKNQFIKIKNEYEKIKNRMNKNAERRAEKLSRKTQTLNSLLTRLREKEIDLTNETEKNKMLEDYYQIMGCVVSYGKWKEGDIITGPHPNLSDYKVNKIIKNDKGLQIVVLTPLTPDQNLSPIFCCRGTTHNPHTLIDDLNSHIGQYSVMDSKKTILETLEEITKEHGSAVITGHSLGGAIAQVITANCCNLKNAHSKPLIKSLYHFNAPGVGKEVAEGYANNIKSIPEIERPRVFKYYHAGDVVALAGGAHLKADVEIKIGQFKVSNLLSPLAHVEKTHTWTYLMSESENVQNIKIHTRKRRLLQSSVEKLRKTISLIFRRMISNKISNQEQLKKTAGNVQTFLKKTVSERQNFIKEQFIAEIELIEKKKIATNERSKDVLLSMYFQAMH